MRNVRGSSEWLTNCSGQQPGWAGERPCLRQCQWGPFPCWHGAGLCFLLCTGGILLVDKARDLLARLPRSDLTGNKLAQTIPFRGPHIHSPLCAASQATWVFHPLPALEAGLGIAPLVKTAKLSLPPCRYSLWARAAGDEFGVQQAGTNILGKEAAVLGLDTKCKANRNEWKTSACLESGILDKAMRTEAVCLTLGAGFKTCMGKRRGLSWVLLPLGRHWLPCTLKIETKNIKSWESCC